MLHLVHIMNGVDNLTNYMNGVMNLAHVYSCVVIELDPHSS